VRATVMYGAGDVRVEQRPDATVRQPTDAVVRVVRSAICGSDLWAYGSMPASGPGRPMGHEFLGVVEDLGAEVTGLKRGDLVLTPSCGPTTPATSAPRACRPPAGTAGATA
jgi:threonine dehydrogenase-like Zn-dependent dehydrogenase